MDMMAMDALVSYIEKHVPLSETEKQWILEKFRIRQVKRKETLLREGEVCRFEFFVLKGCFKSYFYDAEGREVIISFAIENWWLSDLRSLTEGIPSSLNIEALENSEVACISAEDKTLLLDKIPALNKMYLTVVQRALMAFIDRYYNSVAMSASERYHRFLLKFPGLPLRIPQHAIASYLGISPEFLSKIRARRK